MFTVGGVGKLSSGQISAEATNKRMIKAYVIR